MKNNGAYAPRDRDGQSHAPAMLDLADIRGVDPDLVVPEMAVGEPAAGRRVKQTTGGYQHTQIYHALYLPADWRPGRKYPVIVEYAGNGEYRNEYGDACTGRVENSNLGYGISGGTGMIWVCMPFVDSTRTGNQTTWWGDLAATMDYCRRTVAQTCRTYGGDERFVFIAGFSRGAIACNYIGLHDDEIASLWCGFVACSHYDGVRTWPYAGSGRDDAADRLRRLGGRPQFICHEGSVADTRDYLAKACPDGNFTFQPVEFRNHTDEWVLRDIPERRAVRRWISGVLDTSRPARTDER